VYFAGSETDGHRHRQRCGCTGGRGGRAERGDAFGKDFVLARNPGGEPSPWKERACAFWQQSVCVTDSPAEQRPEVEGRRGFSALVLRDSGGATTRGQRSQRCDAAAGEGTSSRGVKDAAGKAVVGSARGFHLRMRGCCRGDCGTETRRTPSGTGMQQARDLECGVSRRGGEKPRGRNVSTG